MPPWFTLTVNHCGMYFAWNKTHKCSYAILMSGILIQNFADDTKLNHVNSLQLKDNTKLKHVKTVKKQQGA